MLQRGGMTVARLCQVNYNTRECIHSEGRRKKGRENAAESKVELPWNVLNLYHLIEGSTALDYFEPSRDRGSATFAWRLGQFTLVHRCRL